MVKDTSISFLYNNDSSHYSQHTSMSILVQTRSEQEEKVILAFLDSLAIQYKTDIEQQEEVFQSFLQEYNQSLDKADSEIEAGNFVNQKDVEVLFEKRRKSI